MAEIATYRCSDAKCRFVVHLSRDFPLWHPETPASVRALNVSPAAEAYVTGLRSDAFCIDCRSIVNISPDKSCATCESSEVYGELLGRTCGQCVRGTFFIEALMVR